jgi:signal transduction histidine kinase
VDEAAAEGRLGVASSIRGRIEGLGGTATLQSGEWGTEWELTVPVRRA